MISGQNDPLRALICDVWPYLTAHQTLILLAEAAFLLHVLAPPVMDSAESVSQGG